MPMPGLSSQPQTTPVTTKETASGYRKMVRNKFSPRSFWSISTASDRPSAVVSTRKQKP